MRHMAARFRGLCGCGMRCMHAAAPRHVAYLHARRVGGRMAAVAPGAAAMPGTAAAGRAVAGAPASGAAGGAALPHDFSAPMDAAYHPSAVEAGWSAWWSESGFFTPSAAAGEAAGVEEKFVMVIPPPNVTGSLHLGHTLTNAVQDALARYNRMRGRVTLWLPGTDHAGIATQSVVERQLLREQGVSRHDLGREEFVRRVWDWKERHGKRIVFQLARLGTSYDWSREAFTLDAPRSRAVIEAFVRLFDRGLIYRDTRLVCWCPHLKTALSDIEVDTEEIVKPDRVRIPGYEKTVEVGYLWCFKYMVAKEQSGDDAAGREQSIEVATTRLETMLGDVAVAVHPEDPRYASLIGKNLVHPFFPERNMKVIADTHVERDFGTGAVKITPAHDKNDYEIGKRHNLEFINIFTEDGRISAAGGKQFAGMHRFECRVELEKLLTKMELLTDKKPNEKPMQLPRCSRSGDIIEYMLLPQWWMDCKSAAARACEAVRSGELAIHPQSYVQTWFYWLENIRDWCISRQLWWGHRIPAFRVLSTVNGEKLDGGSAPPPETPADVWVAGRTLQEAEEKARAKLGHSNFKLVQDDDVLDTWFSSGLFPLSVFNWPDENDADFRAFFPTTLLETGHDILFFWVARMVFFSYLLVDKLPFKTVLLHAMVRDAHGKKMSKSLGNVIDPIEAIEGITLDKMLQSLKDGNLPEKELKRASEAIKKDYPKGIPECGADALRLGLLAYPSLGRSINLDVGRVVGYRFFCNKLWNATKFALQYFPPGFHARPPAETDVWADRWILHALNETVGKANEAFEKYLFSDAVSVIYSFWLYSFCDVYLELAKGRVSSGAARTGAASSGEGAAVKLVDAGSEDGSAAAAAAAGTAPGTAVGTPDRASGAGGSATAAGGDDGALLHVLYHCLATGLRLLHPLIPFVTEELFQRLPAAEGKEVSICVAQYPQREARFYSPETVGEGALLLAVVHQLRSLIAQLDIPPKERLPGYVVVGSPTAQGAEGAVDEPGEGAQSAPGAPGVSELVPFLSARASEIALLARMQSVTVLFAPPAGCITDTVPGHAGLQVGLDGASDRINVEQALAKVQKKVAANRAQTEGYEKKMKAPGYCEKVSWAGREGGGRHFGDTCGAAEVYDRLPCDAAFELLFEKQAKMLRPGSVNNGEAAASFC